MPRTSANDKNNSLMDKYVKMLKDKKKVCCKEDLDNIFKNGYSLAKVIKNLGSCRLQVVEQNGNTADVRISPSVIQMIKRESAVNEIVLIDGGFIKAKIPATIVLDILSIFEDSVVSQSFLFSTEFALHSSIQNRWRRGQCGVQYSGR